MDVPSDVYDELQRPADEDSLTITEILARGLVTNLACRDKGYEDLMTCSRMAQLLQRWRGREATDA